MKPLQTGLTLSITVSVFYSACTVVEVLWPVQFMSFMNALFHGLDFRLLQTTAAFSWPNFLYALCIMALWAFAAGSFFAAVHNVLSHKAPQQRGVPVGS